MRRSKDEVMANILKICLTGSNKTVVVYQSNLNFKTIIPCLDTLMRNGFITPMDGNPMKYKTTEKGKELLAIIEGIHEFL